MPRAHTYLPRQDQDYAFGVGLRMLVLRAIVIEADEIYRVATGADDILAYYANAIGHLAPEVPTDQLDRGRPDGLRADRRS